MKRRRWIAGCAVALAARRASASARAGADAVDDASAGLLTRPIPSVGELLPVVGLGSWITFNVGNDRDAVASSTAVVRAFFAAGGRLIDSSPMYGSSQPTIGHALAQLKHPPALFSAEKVWVDDGARGAAQIEASRRFWGIRSTTCWPGRNTCRVCSR
jgi:Aldo/keto reductase family